MPEQAEQAPTRARDAGWAPSAQQARYLRAVERTGTLTAGCKAAKCSPHTVYAWRDDEAFAAAETIAREAFADALEQEAVRRAWHGVKSTKQVFYRGEPVGAEVKVEYSDTLMVLMLKALRPERYRDRVDHQVSGQGGEPIQFTIAIDRRGDDDGD